MYSASLVRTHSPRFTPTCVCDMNEINGSSQLGVPRQGSVWPSRVRGPPCPPGSKITQQRGPGRAPGSSCLPRRAARSSEAASCRVKSDTPGCVCGLAPLTCTVYLHIDTQSLFLTSGTLLCATARSLKCMWQLSPAPGGNRRPGFRRGSKAGAAVKAAAGTGADRGAGGWGEAPPTFHPSRSSFCRRAFPPKPRLPSYPAHGAQYFPLLWEVRRRPSPF